MRWRLLLIAAAALVAMALVAVVGLFAFRDLTADAVRSVVVPRLEAIIHRDVSITGDFDLVPSVTPTLAAEGLVVANAPWGSRPTMLQAERVEVQVQLLPLLLRREVVIERLALVGADVLLERGPAGQVNWQFDPAAPELAQPERRFLLKER
jgi:AsmA family protein